MSNAALQQHKWSSLPDDIIAKIISYFKLPRGFTVTISPTNFTIKSFKPVSCWYNISEFCNILDNLFTIFTAPSINAFSITLVPSLYGKPCVRSILALWAHRLRARNTRHIAIHSIGNCRFGHEICPLSVFQIHSLVSLHLSSFFIDDECDWFVSHPINLPNLKDLSLGSINYKFLRRLLGNCPSLVYLCFSLNVKPKGENYSVSISSKSLKRLRITLDMSSVLEDIDVIIDAPILEQLYFSANSSFVSRRTFNSISKVKSLQLRGGLTAKLFNSPTKIIFPNLTDLTLLSVSSSEIFKATLGKQMLHCPKMAVLVLQFSTVHKIVWDTIHTKAILVLVKHVKHSKLDMRIVRIDQKTLNLVIWFLRSARVLKKLVICGYGTRCSDDSLNKFRKTLLKCAENTSHCQIEFLGGYKLD